MTLLIKFINNLKNYFIFYFSYIESSTRALSTYYKDQLDRKHNMITTLAIINIEVQRYI
jgi:hypothetical protein